jgi:hypothetical protein
MPDTKKVPTVWLPKDSLLVIAVNIPLWGLLGLCWGLFMAFSTDGQIIKWLIAGILWGATCWFFMTIFVVIAFREVVAGIPVTDTVCLAQDLAEAAKSLRYIVKQDSPTSFAARPKHWLARFFECNKLHIRLYEGNLELTGPVMVVNKVRKKFGRLQSKRAASG